MTRSLLENIARALDEFASGRADLADLQAQMDAGASALDRTFGGIAQELRSLEADLEEIRFARPRAEQRPAALRRLEPVRESVAEALRGPLHPYEAPPSS